MVQIIKAEVSEALAENSGRMLWKFMVTGKGAIKAALEDLLRRFVDSGRVDRKILKGCIKSELTSVDLQRRIWRGID